MPRPRFGRPPRSTRNAPPNWGAWADYLESIVYETELGYGEPLFPETVAPETIPEDEIKKMMKPFKVRLTR